MMLSCDDRGEKSSGVKAKHESGLNRGWLKYPSLQWTQGANGHSVHQEAV